MSDKKEIFCGNKHCHAHVKTSNLLNMVVKIRNQEIYIEREIYEKGVKINGVVKIVGTMHLCTICKAAVDMYIDFKI